MMIPYLVLVIVLIFFIIASIEDIKKREVYDYLNYSLVFFILVISLFDSYLLNSIDPIKYVTFGLLVGFALGSFLYYIGIWGGGDAKFLIGFSASSYYLMNFLPNVSNINYVYQMLVLNFSFFLDFLLEIFLDYILFIDLLVLGLIVIKLVFFRRKGEILYIFELFLILFLLFLGLKFNYSAMSLAFLGFFAFVLIFFANEKIFYSFYLRFKRNINQLKKKDRIDKDIEYKGKKIVKFEEGVFGLTEENIYDLSKYNFKSKIFIRKIFPVSSLITLNFILYIFKIVTIDTQNLEILVFLFKFLFYSFVIGGFLSIFLIGYYFIKNFKKIKISFNNLEKNIIILFVGVIILVSLFIDFKFSILFLIILIYLFLKISKKVEKFMFVTDKNIKKIVPGDWIAEDVFVSGKQIYLVKDFKLGVNEKQLEHINALSKVHSNFKSLKVKDGIPFIPPLLIGFIIVLII